MTDEFTPKAGLSGFLRESHEPSLKLSKFVSLPAPPAFWDGTHGWDDWGMDGNDQWGCCGAAATDHYNMAISADLKTLNTLGQPKFNGTLPTYWAYGLDQGETGQPPNPPNEPDQGVDNASWLAFLYKNGIIDGYAEVDLADVNAAAYLFGGVLLGVQLDDDAQQNFESNPRVPWDSTPGDTPDPSMGHDVLYIGYNSDGSGKVITWGGVQPISSRFIKDNATDAWVILDKDDPEVNQAALRAALEALHGTVDSVPTPDPTPAPAPPQPTPTPPSTFITFLEDIGRYLKSFFQGIFG